MSLKKQNNFIKTMRVRKNTEKMKSSRTNMDLKIQWKPKINPELI